MNHLNEMAGVAHMHDTDTNKRANEQTNKRSTNQNVPRSYVPGTVSHRLLSDVFDEIELAMLFAPFTNYKFRIIHTHTHT